MCRYTDLARNSVLEPREFLFQSVFALRASPDTTLREVALRGCATRSHLAERGGARRDRTADLLHAMQALSQLSYGP